MKIMCYNKGTKEKETNKKCSKLSKTTRKRQCTNSVQPKGSAKGRRDTAKKSMVKGGMKRYDSLQF